MKKIIVILFLLIYPTNSIAHIGHYIKYKKIEMEIFRNGELIGYNHYFFNRSGAETVIIGASTVNSAHTIFGSDGQVQL